MRKLLLICLALSVLFMLVGVTFAAAATAVNGYIADSKCDCTKKLIKEGAKMVVTDDDEKVLTVENPKKLAGHEGHHVAVTGKVTGDSIHVDSVKMM